MTRTLRIISVFLLFFLGISALGGGILLLSDPLGEESGMPLSFLEHSPFDSFIIPGIILILMNGLLSMVFAILVLFKNARSAWLILVQGCILLGWLLIELIMIREYDLLLHTLYLAVCFGLLISGYLLIKRSC